MAEVTSKKISGVDPVDIDLLTGDEKHIISSPVIPDVGDPYFISLSMTLAELIAFAVYEPAALVEKGKWNADTNTPTLAADGTGLTAGDFYVVDVPGPRFGKIWAEDEWILWTGSAYKKVPVKNLLTRSNIWTGLNDFSGAGEVRVKNPTLPSHPVSKGYFDAVIDQTTIDDSANKLFFARPTIVAASYNATTGVPTGVTGNIYFDYTGALRGVIQKIYHNDSVAPTFPGGSIKKGSGSYVTGALNEIYCEFVYSGSSTSCVHYWIVQ